MKKLFGMLLFLLCGATATQAQTSYSVSGRIDDPEMEGRKVYMEVYDTHRHIDTATVRSGQFRFAGTAGHPYFARLEGEKTQYYANFVLEDSVVVDFDVHQPSGGGSLTRKYLAYQAGKDSLTAGTKQWKEDFRKQHPNAPEAEYSKAFNERFLSFYLKWIVQEQDNGIGEVAWRDGYMQFYVNNNLQSVQTLYEHLGSYLRTTQFTKEMEGNLAGFNNTSVGRSYIDIEGTTAEGNPEKLSSFIGKGKLVLVDFWASWCGPCRREGRESLKPLWERYKDKGNLVIVGVAVQDKAEQTKKAIAEERYTWPQILDAGTKPMEQYGIVGIPHILLLAPDGTILARNLRGGAIGQTIENYLKEHPELSKP